ncbi:transposase, partial [Enterococcus faecium]
MILFHHGYHGMKDTIHQLSPKDLSQHCCIHFSRTLSHKILFKDLPEIFPSFKSLYQAPSKEASPTFLSVMIEKCKKNYPP